MKAYACILFVSCRLLSAVYPFGSLLGKCIAQHVRDASRASTSASLSPLSNPSPNPHHELILCNHTTSRIYQPQGKGPAWALGIAMPLAVMGALLLAARKSLDKTCMTPLDAVVANPNHHWAMLPVAGMAYSAPKVKSAVDSVVQVWVWV